MQATLTNRITGSKAKVLIHKTEKSILWISSRAYNAALAKIGNEPIQTNVSFMVYTNSGRPYACMDAE